MRRFSLVVLVFALLLNMLPATALAAEDWDVPGGHYFTQTGGGGGKGYLVTDAGDVRFWSEFQRLGGVQAVGYPASQRFEWDGFTVQVFQRVVFQWRPESKSVAFVNVFDRLDQLGRNDWLRSTRQTPPPKQWSETGMAWEQIVKTRLAVMDTYPAIKAKYQEVVGDPIQANGLPTSDVVDMGNHYALRAQRVVFQQWKEDVPWAKQGQVTVALGGDIAKEAGVLPNAAALQPLASPEASAAPSHPAPTQAPWAVHDDGEKRFAYPRGWEAETQSDGAANYYVSPNGAAFILYMAPFQTGPGFKLEDFQTGIAKSIAGDRTITIGQRRSEVINGQPADLQWYVYAGETPDDPRVVLLLATIQRGGSVHLIGGAAVEEIWDDAERVILFSIRSYVAKSG